MWAGMWKRNLLLLTLAFIPVYLSLSPSESFIPCSFRLGSGARWLGFSNQTPTAHVETLARRGTMGAVSPLRHPAEPRTSWLTSSWSRTGVAEMRNLPQNDSSVSRQLASLGETGAVASAPHSYWRLTSSLSGTGVVVREYPELNANSSSFPNFSESDDGRFTPVIHSTIQVQISGNASGRFTTAASHEELVSTGFTGAAKLLHSSVSRGFTFATLTTESIQVNHIQLIIGIMATSLIVFTSMAFCHMVGAGRGGGGDTNHRVPPRWGPERETSYSFKTYVTDLMLWSMLTDLAPHQQVAAIILRLEGAARELARTLTPQEITQGGMINGVMVDPVSYIVYGLHARFAQLGEESRLVAMTEMLSFARGPRESINEVLTRYEIVRQRARTEGQFVMSTEGCALQLLRACGVNTTQLMQLLQPFGTNLPRNEQELSAMANAMRRMGHILENSPGNIASSLHGNRHGRSHLLTDVFVSMDSDQANAYHNSEGWDRQEGQQEIWRNLTPAPEVNWGYQDPTAAAYPSYQPANTAWEVGYQGEESAGSGGFTTSSLENSYLGNTEDFLDPGYETGTDSDTSSDSGHEEIDMTDLQGYDDGEASAHAYWQYRHAKRKWRRVTNKPTRKFRRLTRKFGRRKGKGKGFRSGFRPGKGSGKGKGIFLAEEREAALAYLKGKGKGKRKGSSGKGTGRRKNPMGRDGQIMRCRICGSDEHFAARCPQANSGSSSSAGPQMNHFVLQDSPDGPLSGLLQNASNEHLALEYSESSSLNFLALRTPEVPEDPLTTQDPWQNTGSTSGNSHFGPSRPRRQVQNERRSGLHAPGEIPSAGAQQPTWIPGAPASSTAVPAANHGGSVFMQQAHVSGGFTTATPPPAPPRGQTVVNSGEVNLTDIQLQHMLTSHQLAGDLRVQHREHLRGRRAAPETSSPLASLPSVFQQLASGGPGPMVMGTAVPIPGTGVNAWTMDSPPRASDQQTILAEAGFRTNAGLPNPEPAAPPPPVPDWPTLRESAEIAAAAAQAEVVNAFVPADPAEELHPPAPATPVIFDGDNRSCTVCIQDFEHGQRVVRLRCRHVFHGDCWMAVHLAHNARAMPRNSLRATEVGPTECPNCRGVGEIIALWDYIDPEHVTQPGAVNRLVGDGLDQLRGRPSEQGTPTPTRQNSESQWGTPESNSSRQGPLRTHRSRSASVRRPNSLQDYLVLPSTYLDANDWSTQDAAPITGSSGSSGGFTSADPDSTETYHSGTRLPDGRPVLLIDPGSVGNLGGDRWAQECAQVAISHGRAPSQARRPRTVSVMGVGNGNQTCAHNCTLPIGLTRASGGSLNGTFTTPVVANSDLPGLMGLHTMRRNRCVLDMVNLQLHMCGPEDIKLSLPTGTETFRLEIAPSGHLVLPCGSFASVRSNPLTTSELVLQTTTTDGPSEPASSSSGPHL